MGLGWFSTEIQSRDKKVVSMDRGAWWAAVRWVAKSWTQQSAAWWWRPLKSVWATKFMRQESCACLCGPLLQLGCSAFGVSLANLRVLLPTVNVCCWHFRSRGVQALQWLCLWKFCVRFPEHFVLQSFLRPFTSAARVLYSHCSAGRVELTKVSSHVVMRTGGLWGASLARIKLNQPRTLIENRCFHLLCAFSVLFSIQR